MKRTLLIQKIAVLSILPAMLWGFSDNAVVVNYIKPANTSSVNITVDPLLMTVALQNELFKTNEFRVVERSVVFNTPSLRTLSMTADYSAYDAMLLGLETGTPWIIMGRVRYMGDQVWIQIGLFDSEMEAKIVEVTGYYPNSRQAIMEKALPELAKRLAKFDQKQNVETKPVVKKASVVLQNESSTASLKEALSEKYNGNNASSASVIKPPPGYYKWAIFGL